MTPQLVVLYGMLATRSEDSTEGYRRDREMIRMYDDPKDSPSLLCDRDMTGDGVTVEWTTVEWTGRKLGKEAAKNLGMLLYGARETGQLAGDPTEVLLPNGDLFQIP